MLSPYLAPVELPETQLRELYDYTMSFVERNNHDLMETLFAINLTLFREYQYVPGSTRLETTPYEVLNIFISPALLATVAAETFAIDPQRLEVLNQLAIRDPLIYSIGRALLGELEARGPASRLYVNALTQTLVVHLLHKYVAFPPAARESSHGLAEAVLRSVMEYVNANPASDLSLAEIAAVAGLSPYYFARCFKQSTGHTIHQYVIEQRLEAANRLLDGRHTIAAVAELTGFADQSHLQRLFKRKFGVTPKTVLEQRKNMQQDRTILQDRPGETD